MTGLRPRTVSWMAAAVLWALAAWSIAAYRGLFWDGTSLLALILDGGGFVWSFYPARAHVMWLTQAPLVAAMRLGVTDTSVLAMSYSAGLFALPAALWQLALWRVRDDAVGLAVVVTAIAAIYLPTCFFIISEFHAAAAIAVAGMAIVLSTRRLRVADAAWLTFLALIALRSYEAMMHLGALLAAATGWLVWREREAAPAARLLGVVAVLLFSGSVLVSGSTVVDYWLHPHFQALRGGASRFWENLQFVLSLAALAPVALAAALAPRLLEGRAIYLASGLIVVLLACSGALHYLLPQTVIHAPSHYVARSVAGLELLVLLAGWFVVVGWPRLLPTLAATLADAHTGRQLLTFAFAFLLAAAIPDLVLTSRWTHFLQVTQNLVVNNSGRVKVADSVLMEKRYSAFGQDWTYPALSLLLRREPSNAILVVPDSHYGTAWNLNPNIRLPPLEGYAWRR